jgi:hypothetical protein
MNSGKKVSLLLLALAALSLSANITRAQEDTAPKHWLRSPATAKGTIGGESHDSYVIKSHKGQTMAVQISWRRAGDNQAEFTVSQSANFFNAEPVAFGRASDNGKRWRAKIPKTGNYYIYVVAHPAADYTLRVTVK